MGNPGNTGEVSGLHAYGSGYGPDRICGAVAYSYNIGKYEVTAGQYTEFLNAVAQTDTYGLYNINNEPACLYILAAGWWVGRGLTRGRERGSRPAARVGSAAFSHRL